MGVSTKITQIRTNGGYAMTGNKCKGRRINLQEIFGADKDSFKELLREVLQEVLARFIHEGAEGRLSRLCFGGEEGNEGAERRWKEPRRVMFR
jgi:hypothetical protein